MSNDTEHNNIIIIDGMEIEKVQEYIYLGQLIKYENQQAEVARRLRLGRQERILKDKKLNGIEQKGIWSVCTASFNICLDFKKASNGKISQDPK